MNLSKTIPDSQRRRLAAKGRSVGRQLLDEVTELFSPDTLLKWYRQLIAAKYDGSPNRKGGRPKVSQEIIDTVLRLAGENPSWGFGRIRNYMLHLAPESLLAPAPPPAVLPLSIAARMPFTLSVDNRKS